MCTVPVDGVCGEVQGDGVGLVGVREPLHGGFVMSG